MNTNKFSDLARRNLTEKFEGCKLVAYRDNKGVLTIGYGHTFHVYEGETCTQDQADLWLVSDIAIAETAVNRLVGVKLTQGEFDALVDFTFNVGCNAFGKSTMLKLINVSAFQAAAKEFEKWDYAGGKEVAGLLRRRKAEEQVFNS